MANVDGGDLNESIPLKNTKKKTCFRYLFEGPRFIATGFVVFSVVLTVALLVQIYYGDFQVVPHGSVATDSRECSIIGTNVLIRGGNAVDSAIASALCLSVINPHTCGLDAGGYMLLYNHRNRNEAKTIDFSAYDGSFPKLLVGLVEAHRFYGHLPWRELVQPAADLAMKGSFVSKQLEISIKKSKAQRLFGTVQAGNTIKQDVLANFLKTIADTPGPYNRAKTLDATASKRGVFRNYNVYVPESSAIGRHLLTGLKHIERLNLTREDVGSAEYTFQLAKLSSELYKEFKVDKNFKEGTSTNVAVMDMNDLYVSLVIGLSEPFGTQNVTVTGYVVDNRETLPNTYLPIILADRDFICAKRLVLGVGNLAAALQIVTGLVIGADNSTTMIEKPRFVMLPNGQFGLEEDRSQAFNDAIVDSLGSLGNCTYLHEPYGSCNIVEKVSDELNSHSDSRGGGFASRF